MESGLTISAQTVADRLWDGDPPAAERETLQAYISRLRSRLRKAGDSVGLIRTSQASGYVLDAPPDLVDVRRFDHAVSGARAATASEGGTYRDVRYGFARRCGVRLNRPTGWRRRGALVR